MILCTANCKYNDGKNVYNICKNEKAKQKPPNYGGIDRIYCNGCELKEDE